MSAFGTPAPIKAVGSLHGRVVFSRRIRVLAREIAALLPPGRLLDIGCGSGDVALAVQELRPDVLPEGFDVLVRKAARIPVTSFDGRRLPVEDDSAAAALLVDVFHHAEDPVALLSECARAASVVVVKDHLMGNAVEEKILAFMDWVGNRPHGVVLRYSYFTRGSWEACCRAAGLRETARGDVADLYPRPFDLVFGRGLHFVVRLERG